jgi:creatinine amidohydrolase
MFLTGHAGSAHMASLRSGATRAVENNPKLKVMVLSDYDIAYDLRGKEFPENDGHAGEIETSRILRLRPELVGKARPNGRTRPPKYMVLKDPERYFPTGVMGDSGNASAKKGGNIDDYIVMKLCELVAENFELKRVR